VQIDTSDEDNYDDDEFDNTESENDEDDDDEDDLVRRSVGQSQQFPQFPDQDSGYEGQQSQGGDEFQETQNNNELDQSNEVEEFQPTPNSQNYGEQSQRNDEQDYLAKQPQKTYETDQNSIYERTEKPAPARPWYKRWGSTIKGVYKDVKNKIGLRETRDYNYRD